MAAPILVAGGDAGDVDEQGRELLATPLVAADRERAERVAVIALPAGDEDFALRLSGLDEILARHLERRLDRFRSTRDEIDVPDPRRCIGDQRIGKLLGHLGGEETR